MPAPIQRTILLSEVSGRVLLANGQPAPPTTLTLRFVETVSVEAGPMGIEAEPHTAVHTCSGQRFYLAGDVAEQLNDLVTKAQR